MLGWLNEALVGAGGRGVGVRLAELLASVASPGVKSQEILLILVQMVVGQA